MYSDEQDVDKSIADYDEAIRLANSFHDQDVDDIEGRGVASLGKADVEDAIPDFDKFLQYHPDSFGVWGARAEAYFDKGDTEHALADFGKAVSLDVRESYNSPYMLEREIVRLYSDTPASTGAYFNKAPSDHGVYATLWSTIAARREGLAVPAALAHYRGLLQPPAFLAKSGFSSVSCREAWVSRRHMDASDRV